MARSLLCRIVDGYNQGKWGSVMKEDRRTTLILILTHGRAGEELINSAKMILGEVDSVVSLPLLPCDDPVKYQSRIGDILTQYGGKALILTDLPGGTPSNCAAAMSRNHTVSAVSGVNLPMLIEAISLRSDLESERLVESLIDASKNGIGDVLKGLESVRGNVS